MGRRVLTNERGMSHDVPEHTTPEPETEEAESVDALARHEPDRPPTEEEEQAAEEAELDPSVAERYREAAELGAEVKGEGQIS
jgi:hypothetical protein